MGSDQTPALAFSGRSLRIGLPSAAFPHPLRDSSVTARPWGYSAPGRSRSRAALALCRTWPADPVSLALPSLFVVPLCEREHVEGGLHVCGSALDPRA